MQTKRHYTCELTAGDYRLRLNVETADPARVEEMARQRAAEHLRIVHRAQTVAMLDMRYTDARTADR